MSKTIYIVTSGEYSDYSIRAVFDDEELARQFVEVFFNERQAYIEEWDLNPYNLEIHAKFKFYEVRMKQDGDTIEVGESRGSTFQDSCTDYYFDGGNNLVVTCLAKDEQHATKIANEKRIQILAANAWELKITRQ